MRKKSLFLICLGFAVVALTSTAALAMNIDVLNQRHTDFQSARGVCKSFWHIG